MYEQLNLMTFQPPTSGVSDSRAKTSASLASKKACKKASEADCFMKLCDYLPDVGKKIDPDGYSLKMLKIYLVLETDLTSRGCSLKWGGHGYSCEWQVLNSKDFGVPQNRERVFIVGYLGDIRGREVFPLRPTDGENPCKLNEITQGVADAQRIYDGSGLARTLKGESGGQGGKTGLYAVKVLKPYGSTGGVCGLKIAENKIGLAAPCAARDYKGISRHNGNAVACAVLTPDREEKRQNGRRMKEPGEPSFTLTAQDRHGVALLDENIRIRRLTPRECWRLQGFPDEYFDKARAAGISDTQLYKQAGNSVSVPVAKAIGAELRRIELCQGDTNNLKITD